MGTVCSSSTSSTKTLQNLKSTIAQKDGEKIIVDFSKGSYIGGTLLKKGKKTEGQFLFTNFSIYFVGGGMKFELPINKIEEANEIDVYQNLKRPSLLLIKSEGKEVVVHLLENQEKFIKDLKTIVEQSKGQQIVEVQEL